MFSGYTIDIPKTEPRGSMRHWMSASLFLVLVGPFLAFCQVQAPDLSLLEQERRIKQEEQKAIQNDILDPILGKEKARVFVDVELEVVTQKQEQVRRGKGMAQKYDEKQKGKGFGETEYLLPGVPRPKTLGSESSQKPSQAQEQQAAQEKELQQQRFTMRTIIKRFQVTVFHDQSVSKSKLDLVRQRIMDALSKYRLTSSQIIFRPTQFIALDFWNEFKQPNVYVPLIFATLFFLLLLFLFGPVSAFLRSYVRTLQENRTTQVTMDSKFEGESGAGQTPGAAGGPAGQEQGQEGESEEEEEMKKFEPFKYINEDNLKRLAYLLRREEPWVIAVVLTYLKPEFARQILTALPVEVQAKVAVETATIRQVTREQVIAIDADIKEKVDFVLGGVEHLSQMLEDSDSETRDHILEYLKNEKPAVYEKVRKSILIFEDIPSFPDREMQVIVRELKTEMMAKSLQNAPPEIINKFLANMSTGAASLLKEEMEYEKELAPAQIQEERKKIMGVVKTLEKEGKVVVRERVQTASLDGLEEEVSSSEARQSRWAETSAAAGKGSAAVSPEAQAQAQSYLSAGAQAYQAGQHEAAVSYLEYGLSLDPGQWQAYSYLGAAYYALGKAREAVAAYEKLLAYQPDPNLKQWVESLKASILQNKTA